MSSVQIRIDYLALLAVVLLGPILLRPFAEIYPAILLPSGGHTIRSYDSPTIPTYRIEAITSEGDTTFIDHHRLLATIPAQYRGHILRRRFGLEPIAPRTKSVRIGPYRIRLKLEYAPDRRTRRDGRDWLRRRIAPMVTGDPVALVIRFYRHPVPVGFPDTTIDPVLRDTTLIRL